MLPIFRDDVMEVASLSLSCVFLLKGKRQYYSLYPPYQTEATKRLSDRLGQKGYIYCILNNNTLPGYYTCAHSTSCSAGIEYSKISC